MATSRRERSSELCAQVAAECACGGLRRASRAIFLVAYPGSRERYAVCAIDALGIPAMLGAPVTISSRCHHCGEPLEIRVRPDGSSDGSETTVWVGERRDIK